MPPRKGIVKSGNAGNSAKPSAALAPASTAPDAGPKPLFPPGSKYPLSLLQERCQKNGWEKPIVDTRRHGDGFSFVVTLSRLVHNKQTGQERQSVRLEPHPPYSSPTAIEARHWGATYALYRFCNGIQLNRVLPQGPREYWNELAVEHKAAPTHQAWMYEADPFAARKGVDDRQDKVVKKKAEVLEAKSSGQSSPASNEFSSAPEVKMATDLRDLVESAIKKTMAAYPETEEDAALTLSEDSIPSIRQQLENLGFKPAQVRSAITFLSRPSALTSNLLRSASPLDACIEYLILHIPEVDLPQRFLPANNTSNPFVTSIHSGEDSLEKRWIEERAIKLAGFPAHVVRECTAKTELLEDWSLLVAALNRRLIGADWQSVSKQPLDDEPDEKIGEEDITSMGASYLDERTLQMPLFSAPIQLNFVIPPDYLYNSSTRPPPMYVTSPSVPAYVRLHLLARLLEAFEQGEIAESGNGICLGAMTVLEEQWSIVEDEGPPDMFTALKHLMPAKPAVDDPHTVSETMDIKMGRKKRFGPRRRDPRSNAQIKGDFEALQKNSKWDEMQSVRQRLPAFKSHGEFLSMLDKSRVVIVVGETGSGKTTQLPQFILDSLITRGQGSTANILITQPRRISAISVSARVHAERMNDGSVGYSIRGESKQTDKTKLLFCTTGVLLRRLSTGDQFSDVSHVVVDEVHERSVDGDFLLLELKELLLVNPLLKVVLMSATINHETFVQYFNGAPLLTIPGFTHPVTDKYLEEVMPHLDYRPAVGKIGKRRDDDDEDYAGLDHRTTSAVQAVIRSDRVDFSLVAAVVNHIISTADKKGGILVFLPGVQEIRQCIDLLRSSPKAGQAAIFPLHANLSSDEQRAVFASTPKWKIVVATNVAETSITIDDIVYVVDAGKVKETQYDTDSGLTKLVEQWVTRAAARQRRGRAGRTQPGICYKLYTRAQERKWPAFPKPEILRVPLESICLTVKSAKEHDDVKKFLSRAIDPPAVAAMDKALEILEELGAIDAEGNLTALGRHMALLPVDLRLGKMLILATIFRCLDPILTIAACLSSKPVFLNPIDKRDEANKARANFLVDKSDILTDAHAYDECARLHADGKNPGFIRNYCEENFISASTIRDITTLRGDLHAALTGAALLPPAPPSAPALNTHSGSTPLLKALLLAALYPRVARIALPRGALKFEQLAGGTVQREATAKEWRAADMRGARVWIHPASALFAERAWRSGVVVSFARVETGRVFLRDVTEVPLYALLLFGGNIHVNHIAGGLTIGGREGFLRLKAWPRIGILVQQLRRLLDSELMRSVEAGHALDVGKENAVVSAMLALLTSDGMAEGLG
ncbi:P-loop containing nucleoside triphosphate hydrolase protein [Auriscalpium vulgare]|uniref:P-loop containing nucleoside triphosphate hydrolase protein n=1 Tax=Auriscalpium vulgare TaxID=40419 RepID=A0ACB8RD40_9AGAM|nr:P-loop containing nucleoside triphosphate hydrolase protein [Auriscalpium vulgare]